MHVARLSLAAALLASAFPAHAQTSVRIRADNDAFNFWQPPWARPDEEYTSGVRLSVDFTGAALWARRADTSAVGDCGAEGGRCISHTLTLGQDIFTPARRKSAATPPPGSRPDAGMLWLQDEQRVAAMDRLVETSVTVGVTGKPSLASVMQRIAHGYSAAKQRPIDWSNQLPFEPVVGVAYDQHRRTRVLGVPLQPHAGASLGNILTELRAGVGMQGGWHHVHPWMPAKSGRRAEVSFLADATLRAVAWNETLSGNMFRSSERVTLRPLVAEFKAGISARFHRATLAYVVHQRGSEYTTRQGSHRWSLLQTSWQLE